MSETSIWGGDDPLVAWNQNSWQSNQATVSLTGVSATTSVGDVKSFPEQGWGSDSWGDENWGESSLDVTLSGVAGTMSVGSVTISAEINSSAVSEFLRVRRSWHQCYQNHWDSA